MSVSSWVPALLACDKQLAAQHASCNPATSNRVPRCGRSPSAGLRQPVSASSWVPALPACDDKPLGTRLLSAQPPVVPWVLCMCTVWARSWPWSWQAKCPRPPRPKGSAPGEPPRSCRTCGSAWTWTGPGAWPRCNRLRLHIAGCIQHALLAHQASVRALAAPVVVLGLDPGQVLGPVLVAQHDRPQPGQALLALPRLLCRQRLQRFQDFKLGHTKSLGKS